MKGARNKKSLKQGLHWFGEKNFSIDTLRRKLTKPILPVLLFLLSEEPVFSIQLKKILVSRVHQMNIFRTF